MKISYKVPLMSTAVIAASFSIFSLLQYNIIKSTIYEQTESRLAEVSTLLGQNIGNWLNHRLNLVQGIAEIASINPSIENLRWLFTVPRFNESAAYFYGGLDTDGLGINDLNARWTPPPGWDARTRPWYEVAKRHKDSVMTEPYPSATDARMLITAVSQIYDGRNSIGAMGADIELNEVSAAVNAVNFDNTGYAFLIDESGSIITHPDKNKYAKNISTLYEKGTPKLESQLQQNSIEGTSVLTAFYPLRNFDASEKTWYLVAVVDEKKILAPASSLGTNGIIAAVVTAVISAFVLLIFMNESLIRPVNTLTTQADNISRGQLKQNIDGTERKDEIGALATSVDRLKKSLAMAMDRVKKISKKPK